MNRQTAMGNTELECRHEHERSRRGENRHLHGRAHRNILSTCLSITLLVSLVFTFPIAALASNESASISASWRDAADKTLSGNDRTYAYATSQNDAATAGNADAFEGLPSKYDLRDPNGDGDRSDSVVSPVKLQLPWGTCWAFSICAASETSILSKASKTYAEQNIDLSELHLANSVYLNGGAPESIVGSAQAGEGFHDDSGDPNAGLDAGGHTFYGSTVFSSGIGPLPESAAPYKNKEGIIECNLFEEGSSEPTKLYLTQSEFEKYEKSGANIKRLNWAGNYRDDNDKLVFTDWSSSASLWNSSILNLENGNVLPGTVVKVDGEYDHTDLKAVAAIKKEMCENGRAVAMAFTAFEGYYDADYASYYNCEANDASHAVCIVGWDDDFPKTNFNGGGASVIPPENGAWLVKNSYGSESEDFPNYGDFGIKEDGKHTGYFWLSYYDQSVAYFESFDFDLASYGDETEYYVDQYDYLVADKPISNSYDAPTSSANIFSADGDMSLRTVGCTTYKPNTTVLYQVYLLDGEAATPTDPAHSKLAYSFEDTYQYGGYHRATIGKDSWIAMRKGQRYAVITTQYCNDDGKWYQGVGVNESKLGFKARLNAGESWTGTSNASASAGAAGSGAMQGADGQTNWSDWTTVAAGIKEKDSGLEVDNASIKAFAEIRSWASVEELSALEEAIAKAKDALDSSVASEDGSDVPDGVAWMTQEQKDALSAALAEAQAKLELAGSDYRNTLANTTPSSVEANEAIRSLALDLSYGGAKSNIAAKGAMPATGDAASSVVLVLACMVAAAGAVLVTLAIRSVLTVRPTRHPR